MHCGNSVRQAPSSIVELRTHSLRPAERLRALEEDNRRLSESLHTCLEEITSLRSSAAPRPVSVYMVLHCLVLNCLQGRGGKSRLESTLL